VQHLSDYHGIEMACSNGHTFDKKAEMVIATVNFISCFIFSMVACIKFSLPVGLALAIVIHCGGCWAMFMRKAAGLGGCEECRKRERYWRRVAESRARGNEDYINTEIRYLRV